MENANVRNAAKNASIALWKVAAKIGVSEATLTRWLRIPLSKDREAMILLAIKELKKEM